MAALFKNRASNAPDQVLVAATFLLVIFGLVMLASASSDLGKLKFGDSYFYLKHQLIYGLSIGLIGFWAASKFYYRYYENFAVIGFLLSLMALILIFTPLGLSSGGATRWLDLGPFSFQ